MEATFAGRPLPVQLIARIGAFWTVFFSLTRVQSSFLSSFRFLVKQSARFKSPCAYCEESFVDRCSVGVKAGPALVGAGMLESVLLAFDASVANEEDKFF